MGRVCRERVSKTVRVLSPSQSGPEPGPTHSQSCVSRSAKLYAAPVPEHSTWGDSNSWSLASHSHEKKITIPSFSKGSLGLVAVEKLRQGSIHKLQSKGRRGYLQQVTGF